MDKIMILGASVYQVPLIRTAKRMGLYTIVASIPGNYPGFSDADKVCYINTTDKEAILKVCREEGVSGICTSGTDVAVATIGYVNEQLGLAGVSEAAANNACDKYAMKEAFRKGGVSASEFIRVMSLEEAYEAAEEIGYPVVVKCVDSSGSRGINVVKTPSDLIIVGARPAMGKTSFALNLAANVAKKGNKVLFFSLEMTKEQLAERVISMEARIHGQKMRNGRLSPSDWTNFSTVAGALHEIPLYFDDTSNITVNEMKAKVRRMKDIDVVIIDYLQLMQSGTRTESRVQEVSQITRNLKLMAKDLEVPVIVLCQLSRSTEARGKSHRPQLADLRESGSIEQDADIVLMLYRDDYYQQPGAEEENMERNDINTVEIIVAKNRHGPVGSVDLAWNSEFTLFTSIEKRSEDDIFA